MLYFTRNQLHIINYIFCFLKGGLLNHMVFGGIERIFLSLKSIVQLYFYEK